MRPASRAKDRRASRLRTRGKRAQDGMRGTVQYYAQRMLRGVHLLRCVSTALRTACGLKHRPPKRTGTWETVRRTRNAVNDAQTQAKERYAVWTRPP
eukprot:scaffold241_cov340-Pavlova_lutheri.AAC.33